MPWIVRAKVGFSGSFAHTINANGRVSIPSKFRELLEGCRSGDKLTLIQTKKCVKVFPMAVWDKFFNDLPENTPADVNEKRKISASSADVEIDKNGRILLPPEFRERFSSDCLVVGMGELFEIWDINAWHEMTRGADSGELSPNYRWLDL
jgi:MraZ protein